MGSSELDQQTRRCPRLGHPVRFAYCRTQAENALCPHILDCWWELFDVRSHLVEEGYSDAVAELEKREAPPPKLATLAELVEKAQQRRRNADKSLH